MQCGKLPGRLGWLPHPEDLQDALLSCLRMLALAICVAKQRSQAGAVQPSHRSPGACRLSVIELVAQSNQGL